MDDKPFRMGEYKHSQIYVDMPIDPTVLRFISARINEKIELAFGVPQGAQEQQDIPLTIDALRAVMPPFRQTIDTVVCNIDDALDLFRQLRKIGYKVKRRERKGRFFSVWVDDYPAGLFTVIVDTWRHTPRGKMITFDSRPPFFGLGKPFDLR